jgi:outer membrane lipoprotein carrier protein
MNDSKQLFPDAHKPRHPVVSKRLGKVFAAGLLAFYALPALADANALLQAFVEKTRTLQGRFAQSVHDSKGRVTQESSGEFAISRPGKFRWAYAAPYSQLIVGDGKKVWIHDADLEQVTVRKFDSAMGSSPAALLAGSNEIEKHFKLKDSGTQQGLSWLDATPINDEGTFSRVRMGFADSNLQVMELQDNFGQTTRLRFESLRLNPKLGADIFRFKTPKGSDVINAD